MKFVHRARYFSVIAALLLSFPLLACQSESSQSAEEPKPVGNIPGLGCEHERPGPKMVEIPFPDGSGSYCIDTTEVTQAQYELFLKADNKPALSPELCSASYEPIRDNPEEPSSMGCTPQPGSDGRVFSPDITPHHPVACISWCSAKAYCEWAGKRLCGPIAGSARGDDELLRSEWAYACSSGGKNVYPYGNEYKENTCWDGHMRQAADMGGLDVAGYLKEQSPYLPVGELSECSGEGAPFNQLLDMAGNVDEWGAYCEDGHCEVRRGEKGKGCAQYGITSPNMGAHIGIRCCADP